MARNAQDMKIPARETKAPKEFGILAAFAKKLMVNPKIMTTFGSKLASLLLRTKN